MTNDLMPQSEADLCDAIAQAIRGAEKLAIIGGATKSGVGRHVENARRLDMRSFSGIVDYDPAELVLTVRAGTPLAEVEALVASREQKLAFAPFDYGPVFGRPAGASTIGGVIAASVAGSQRVSQGSARDHLLGFRAVSGRGETFIAGAKVVKNVTGYDLSKLVSGSWGRLVALTEVTLKVLPRPRLSVTKALEGLDAADAVRLMSRALGSQADVSAAAHIPGQAGSGASLTLLKVEGFGPSVAARCAMLDTLLSDVGNLPQLESGLADHLWSEFRTLAPLADDAPLWRINVAPREGAGVVAAIEPLGAKWMMDWGGGLIWAAVEGDSAIVRDAATRAGGHAMLVRGPAALRDRTAAFHPPVPGVAALEERVRHAFDPNGVFETGRF
jgi:glycolate oxidase FAD binding subunit